MKKVVLPKLSWTSARLEAFQDKQNNSILSWQAFKDTVTLTPELKRGVLAFADDEDEFPGCCAFEVYYGLPTETVSVLDAEYPGYLSYVVQQLRREHIWKLLTTTKSQVFAEKVLSDIGAKKLVTVRNPNTQHLVTLWLVK